MSNSANANVPPKPPVMGSVPPPKSNVPPKLPRNKNLPGRIITLAGLGAFLMMALIFGFVVISQLTRKDKPADYVLLCKMLFEPISQDGVTPVQLSDTERELKIEALEKDIKRISWRDRKLSPVARGVLQMYNDAPAVLRSAPDGSKLSVGVAEALLGCYAGQRELVGSGGEKALNEIQHFADAYKAIMALVTLKQKCAIELADISPIFSGPATNGSVVNCSFAEHQPRFLEVETTQALGLVNQTGQQLDDCVIFVRFSDAAGKSQVNVHFAPSWPADGKLTARYSSYDFPKDMMEDVVRLDVSIWTRELSVESITMKKPANGWPD